MAEDLVGIEVVLLSVLPPTNDDTLEKMEFLRPDSI